MIFIALYEGIGSWRLIWLFLNFLVLLSPAELLPDQCQDVETNYSHDDNIVLEERVMSHVGANIHKK